MDIIIPGEWGPKGPWHPGDPSPPPTSQPTAPRPAPGYEDQPTLPPDVPPGPYEPAGATYWLLLIMLALGALSFWLDRRAAQALAHGWAEVLVAEKLDEEEPS